VRVLAFVASLGAGTRFSSLPVFVIDYHHERASVWLTLFQFRDSIIQRCHCWRLRNLRDCIGVGAYGSPRSWASISAHARRDHSCMSAIGSGAMIVGLVGSLARVMDSSF